MRDSLKRWCGVGVCALCASGSMGELVVFENTNPELESLTYYEVHEGYTVVGQSLTVTRGAFDQPGDGELPEGSIFVTLFAEQTPNSGSWLYMGTGFNTQIAIADDMVEVIDPFTHHSVGHIAPDDFDDGREIDASANWWDPVWVTMHADVSTAPAGGVYFTDESFMIGVRFTLDDGVHYGFAEMTRTAFDPSDPMSIKWMPTRWGYETTAGAPVPGVGTLGVLGLGMGFGVRRRR